MNAAARAALAGLASGARSVTGIAALAATAPAGAARQPDKALSRGWVTGLIGLLAAQEVVVDKLPTTPSRLAPGPLGGRLAAGAVVGYVVARRTEPTRVPVAAPLLEPAITPPPRWRSRVRSVGLVLLSVGLAAAGSVLGARFRAPAARWAGADWPGAVVEDAWAIALATAAARG